MNLSITEAYNRRTNSTESLILLHLLNLDILKENNYWSKSYPDKYIHDRVHDYIDDHGIIFL